MLYWEWLSFEELTRDTLFEVMKARQEVFIVEQNCVYQDIDDLDRLSWHLVGWQGDESDKKLAAYLRVVFPGEKYSEPSIGRVITVQSVRGNGVGNELLAQALSRMENVYPDTKIRISAQCYLEKFYSKFGFVPVSDQYDEDGIAHIEMLR